MPGRLPLIVAVSHTETHAETEADAHGDVDNVAEEEPLPDCETDCDKDDVRESEPLPLLLVQAETLGEKEEAALGL